MTNLKKLNFKFDKVYVHLNENVCMCRKLLWWDTNGRRMRGFAPTNAILDS